MTKQYNFTSISLLSDKYDGVMMDISTVPDGISEFEKELETKKLNIF